MRSSCVVPARTFGTALLAFALCAVPTAAAADTCDEAFTRSSTLAHKGKLLDARAELRVCAAEGCPETMRTVCTRDIDALEPRIPSVVVRARDPETQQDMVAVAVRVDGLLIEESLDGKARELDPGPHTFRFERQGSPPSEQRVLLEEGEKHRFLTVDWSGSSSPIAARSKGRPLPATFWLAGGLTLVAGGVWAATGIDAFVQKSDLGSCKASGCPHDHIQTTQTLFNVADVSGGVTLALAALTTVILLTRPQVGPPAAVEWLGGVLRVTGSF